MLSAQTPHALRQRSAGAVLVRADIGGKQHTDRHKAEPKARLPQSPWVEQDHHRTSGQPNLGPGPAPPAGRQNRDQAQHPDGALRRNAPAAEHGIQHRQPQTSPTRGLIGRHPQTPGGAPAVAAPPNPSHPHRTQPSKHGHMQSRNADQMGHAGGPKNIPISALNAGLIAHQQGADQARPLGVWDARLDAFAHPLTPLCHRVLPGGFHANGRRICAACPHIAGGPQVLLPHPQFKIKAVGIDLSVGLFEPHHHAPTLTRLQVRCLTMLLKTPAPRIPTQQHLWWQGHAFTLPVGRLNGQAKTQAVFGALRQGRDHAHHRHITPFQMRRQQAFGMPDSAQPCHSKHQPQDGEKHLHPGHAGPQPGNTPTQPHTTKCSQAAGDIGRRCPQGLMPKMTRGGGHTGQSRRGDAVFAAVWVHAPSHRGKHWPPRA